MIFDVLKYPVSIPPTAEEFRRIPTDLFNRWAYMSNWSPWNGKSFDRKSMAELYEEVVASNIEIDTDCNRRRERYINELLLLRRMIKEYEE